MALRPRKFTQNGEDSGGEENDNDDVDNDDDDNDNDVQKRQETRGNKWKDCNEESAEEFRYKSCFRLGWIYLNSW